jgi:hypothetical protein
MVRSPGGKIKFVCDICFRVEEAATLKGAVLPLHADDPPLRARAGPPPWEKEKEEGEEEVGGGLKETLKVTEDRKHIPLLVEEATTLKGAVLPLRAQEGQEGIGEEEEEEEGEEGEEGGGSREPLKVADRGPRIPLVNRRIRKWFPDAEAYYEGTVTQSHMKDGRALHHVQYDDGGGMLVHADQPPSPRAPDTSHY